MPKWIFQKTSGDQQGERDLSNFENCFDGELSKNGHHFSNKVIVKTDVIKKVQ